MSGRIVQSDRRCAEMANRPTKEPQTTGGIMSLDESPSVAREPLRDWAREAVSEIMREARNPSWGNSSKVPEAYFEKLAAIIRRRALAASNPSPHKTAKEFCDKYGHNLTRLSAISARIVDLVQAYGDYAFAYGERAGYARALAASSPAPAPPDGECPNPDVCGCKSTLGTRQEEP
jgi:hypothetical protein